MSYLTKHCVPAIAAAGCWAMMFGPAAALDFGKDLSDPGIPGFEFPEPETSINQWIASKAIWSQSWATES